MTTLAQLAAEYRQRHGSTAGLFNAGRPLVRVKVTRHRPPVSPYELEWEDRHGSYRGTVYFAEDVCVRRLNVPDYRGDRVEFPPDEDAVEVLLERGRLPALLSKVHAPEVAAALPAARTAHTVALRKHVAELTHTTPTSDDPSDWTAPQLRAATTYSGSVQAEVLRMTGKPIGVLSAVEVMDEDAGTVEDADKGRELARLDEQRAVVAEAFRDALRDFAKEFAAVVREGKK